MSLNLEKDIAQCGKYISYIYRKSSEHISKIIKEFGLSGVESILLIGIYRYPGLSQIKLAQAVAMDTGAVSRTLRKLELNDLIYKKVDESNRRNFILYLTEKGIELTEQNLLAQQKYWNETIKDIDHDKVLSMNDTLRELQCNVYEMEILEDKY